MNFSWKCRPDAAGCRPKKSFHWPIKMMTAMPDVKPTITGLGMNLMTLPSRASPMTSRMTPAMSVAACRPAMPYCAVMPASTAMKAPVGPEICTRVPPSTEVARPATMAVYRPCAGFAPEAIAKAIASGSATMPTTTPATTLGIRWARCQQAGALRFEQGDHGRDYAVRNVWRG